MLPLPLASRKWIARSVPHCPACGARRRFEFQLLSTLLEFLVPATAQAGGSGAALADGTGAVDGESSWLTIVVFSCEVSCEAGSSEHVHVELEPDAAPRRRAPKA